MASVQQANYDAANLSTEDQLVARITATVLAALQLNVSHQYWKVKDSSSNSSQYCFTHGLGGIDMVPYICLYDFV